MGISLAHWKKGYMRFYLASMPKKKKDFVLQNNLLNTVVTYILDSYILYIFISVFVIVLSFADVWDIKNIVMDNKE